MSENYSLSWTNAQQRDTFFCQLPFTVLAVNSLGCLADGNRTTDNDSGMLSLARSLVLRKSNVVDSTGVMCRLGHPQKDEEITWKLASLKRKRCWKKPAYFSLASNVFLMSTQGHQITKTRIKSHKISEVSKLMKQGWQTDDSFHL